VTRPIDATGFIRSDGHDNAGRVVKTNAGDGVWKVLVYDANGNATLKLSALTRDMSGDRVDAALWRNGEKCQNP
jgi:hypothetical protein